MKQETKHVMALALIRIIQWHLYKARLKHRKNKQTNTADTTIELIEQFMNYIGALYILPHVKDVKENMKILVDTDITDKLELLVIESLALWLPDNTKNKREQNIMNYEHAKHFVNKIDKILSKLKLDSIQV